MHRQLGSLKEMHEHLDMVKKYRYKVTHKEQILLDHAYAWMKHEDVSKSVIALKRATLLYPTEKQIFSDLGGYYEFYEDDLDSSIILYNKVLDLDPNHRWTLNHLGYVYLGKGDYKKALEYLQRYANVAPNEQNPYDSMAEVYLIMGDYKKSIEMYEKASQLQLEPDLSKTTGIASNLIKMGEYKKAREYLYQWSESAGAYGYKRRMFRSLAMTYIADGDLENTFKEMEKIGHLAMQKLHTVWVVQNEFDICEILYENGELKEAELKLTTGKNLIETADIPEQDNDFLLRLYFWHSSRLTIKKGKLDQATEYAEMFKKRVEKNKDTDQMKRYFALSGLLAYTRENYEKAISDLIKSEQDDDPFTNYYLALAYQKNENQTKAIEKLESIA
jgi:tetratricopeptide (TPR) repeat protein